MTRCSQILSETQEIDNNLQQLIQMSKTSSPFNDTHLKYSKIGQIIESSIKSNENQISLLEKKETKNLNKYQSKIVYNTIDTLKIKLEDLSIRYQKFLKSQGDTIRTIEKRRANLINSESHKKKKKNNVSNMYSSLPEADYEEDNAGFNETMQKYKSGNNEYYQDRNTAVQHIEKAMNDLSGMFNRISQMIYRQGEMIERIDNETNISLNNVKMAQDEVIKLKDDVKSNRKLLFKIFAIIIIFIILYIIFVN